MPKYLTQKEAYLKCKKEGNFIVIEDVDIEKIKSTLIIAKNDIASAEILRNNSENLWSSIYKLYYEALHELVEAFLRFDKIKITNHQCLFVYLCENYSELEFNWEFFEKIRTKRNGINYYGALIDSKDWKEVELQFKLYIKKLIKEIDKRLK